MSLYTTWTSPVGPLRLLGTDAPGVTGGLALTGLYLPEFRGAPQPDLPGRRDDRAFAAVGAALAAYFAGELTTFDLPLAPAGTPFQQRVWAALREIPYGQTASYGELARAVGASARAVGSANGRNPVSIVVPCHRVIGADGSLTGYGGGLGAKRWLLDHEAAVAGRPVLLPS